MTVGIDSVSATQDFTGSPITGNATPVGTVRGVAAGIIFPVTGVALTSVTYGGVSMTEVAASPITMSASESTIISMFFLGTGVPQGTQSVTFTGTWSAGGWKVLYFIWFTSGTTQTALADTDGVYNTDTIELTGTLSIGGISCVAGQAFFTGVGSVGGISPKSGWTSGSEQDIGSQVLGVYYLGTPQTADITYGNVCTINDEQAALACAVYEVSSASSLLLPRRFRENQHILVR